MNPRSCAKYLDKDTIKPEIRPHLSVAIPGYISEGNLAEVVTYILYKLKTACR